MNSIVTKIFAERIRLESIRSMAVEGKGHVGGVLSAADVIAVLYENIMNYKADNPQYSQRDRLVFSKGHCGPVLYSALALKGFFSVKYLSTLNVNNTFLPSHCNAQKTPGVDVSTGSLGQGASLAAGIAIGMKMRNYSSKTFLLLGDGECDEGQVWEMAMFASHYKLNNLIAFVDRNHQQLDGYTKDVMDVGDLAEKFKAFGWDTVSVDGHDVEAIYSVTNEFLKTQMKPCLIVLETIKGKGWSKTEGKPNVHHVVINNEDLVQAETEISERIQKLERMLK